MSAVGLTVGHIDPHFNAGGFCICPCGACTTRTGQMCVCLDCPCEHPGEHAPD